MEKHQPSEHCKSLLQLALEVIHDSIYAGHSFILTSNYSNAWITIAATCSENTVNKIVYDFSSEIEDSAFTRKEPIIKDCFRKNYANGWLNVSFIPYYPNDSLILMLVIVNSKAIDIGNGDTIIFLQQHVKFFSHFIKFFAQGFINNLNTWKSSFFEGSRKLILNQSINCLNTVSHTCSPKTVDFLRALSIDANTQLQIVPPSQTIFVENASAAKVK